MAALGEVCVCVCVCVCSRVHAARALPHMSGRIIGVGTDVFKALALGAKAVGIGRPALYGLASYGQARSP